MEEIDLNEDGSIPRLPVDSESYSYNGWDIIYHKSHILKSVCPNQNLCVKDDSSCCELCNYRLTLELPSLPDMVFPKNILSLTYRNGANIQFTPMDALRFVRNEKMNVRVACADEWQESRPQQLCEQKLKPFDWTFSTNYQGTHNEKIKIEDTNLKIDIFKLLKKEPILFYHDLSLFEDELHDHGVSSCSVKIRVMPSGFYVLLRYFLRIDDVMIRMNDTRYHYEKENDYILREYTYKEAKVDNLKHVPPALFVAPQEIEKHLPVLQKTVHKLIFID